MSAIFNQIFEENQVNQNTMMIKEYISELIDIIFQHSDQGLILEFYVELCQKNYQFLVQCFENQEDGQENNKFNILNPVVAFIKNKICYE